MSAHLDRQLEGLQLIYSFMSCESEARMWNAIECELSDDDGNAVNCGNCNGCRNDQALISGLAALGKLISKIQLTINKRKGK